MSRRSQFSPAELTYLREGGKLGRVATLGKDGTPHVVPTGWTYNAEHNTIDVTGRDVPSTRKFADVMRHPRASIVIDDIASRNLFTPRAVEVRGRAEAVRRERLIRIHPEEVASWGLGTPSGA